MSRVSTLCTLFLLAMASVSSAVARDTSAAAPVVVAVIDSGVLADHPSLKGQLLPGADLVSGSFNQRGGRSHNAAPDARDAECPGRAPVAQFRTHGTEVASTIVGNGGQGVLGVAPNAKVVPIRVMSACGMQRRDLIDSLAWAAGLPVPGLSTNAHPARIINLSLAGGRSTCSADLQAMVDQLVNRGVFVVAAVGNTFGQRLKEPANCKGVISVGAVTDNNQVAHYSAVDERTVIYASGGGGQNAQGRQQASSRRVASFDLSTVGSERPSVHNRRVGTSFSAPVVAGFIARWMEREPHITPQHFSQHMADFVVPVHAVHGCAECQPKRLVTVDPWVN